MVIPIMFKKKYINRLAQDTIILGEVEKLFRKNKDSELSMELLAGKIDHINEELKRVEVLEKSLVEHEIILTKKVKDIYDIEERLKELADKKEISEIKDTLKKFNEHDEILFEQSKFTRELVKELDKIKQSHKITREHILSGENMKRRDFDQEIEKVKSSINNLEHIKLHNKKKASREELKELKEEVIERMNQIEHQQKTLLKFLKDVTNKP